NPVSPDSSAASPVVVEPPSLPVLEVPVEEPRVPPPPLVVPVLEEPPPVPSSFERVSAPVLSASPALVSAFGSSSSADVAPPSSDAAGGATHPPSPTTKVYAQPTLRPAIQSTLAPSSQDADVSKSSCGGATFRAYVDAHPREKSNAIDTASVARGTAVVTMERKPPLPLCPDPF